MKRLHTGSERPAGTRHPGGMQMLGPPTEMVPGMRSGTGGHQKEAIEGLATGMVPETVAPVGTITCAMMLSMAARGTVAENCITTAAAGAVTPPATLGDMTPLTGLVLQPGELMTESSPQDSYILVEHQLA